ncbi:hypothetical protein EPO33_00760 [Patescibacteria group bacterium]|nr:MAG: hypothetical protein EPO33_00760 [Patescibacteria group bacterium]
MSIKIAAAVVLVFAVFAAGGFYLTRTPAPASEAAQADIGSALPRSGQGTNTGGAAAAPVETAPPSDAVDAEDVREVVIVGDNFAFSTKTLALKSGQKVRLTFVNNEGMHDFRLDEFGVATKKLKAGESETVEFTPDKTGTFEAYCSVGVHRAMGMVTAVTVE